MEIAWPFEDPPETEVITLGRVAWGESPLRVVTHDEDDGAWQFLDGDHVTEDDALVISLGEMVQFDPSLASLADLPMGWHAWRADAMDDWQRAEGDPPLEP